MNPFEGKPGRDERPGPGSTFSLRPGVRLEPLGDGSAVLYSQELDTSLSLNHTAALLCSFADGQHTLAMIVQEMRQVFPGDVIDESALKTTLRELETLHFLQWN